MEQSQKPRILIVDDVPENIKVLISGLEHDYKLSVATNGKDALELAKSDNPPDLILLDIMMPLMDGYEVCRQIKSDKTSTGIPIIFLTAKNDALDETHGLTIGAVDYITKPFSLTVVKARVKTQVERKRAQDALVKMERLAAVADLAAGVAHHFNNMLQVIMGGASVALTRSNQGDGDAVEDILHQIIESSRFGSQTVRRLQEFVKIGTGETDSLATFDLSNTALQAIETTRRQWKTGAENRGLCIRLVPNLPAGCIVEGKESELFEVITNLIRNAVEAMPQGGELRVETCTSGGDVILRVADTGGGVPQENLGKIFEPFFTTKGFQQVGMGLPTCYGILKSHGGTISVESEPGQGAVFTVGIPRSMKEPADTEAARPYPMGAPLRILAVDDVEPITMMLSDLLGVFGHEVLMALSGEDAIQIFNEQPVDLVISDLGMPKMNGWEVGKQVKLICEERRIPKVPFILLTGWGGQSAKKGKMEESGVDVVVEKPLDPERLLALVEELIRGRSPGG